jgi:hypothetical protein
MHLKIVDMAANCNAAGSVDVQHQCFNTQITENCVNCALKEQQLQAIISLLREDIKYANLPTTKVIHTPVQTVETTVHDQANLSGKQSCARTSTTKDLVSLK